jgi:hypothetical protein
MIKQFIYIMILLISSSSLMAQSKEKEKYTPTALKTFLKIYKHTLDVPFDPIISMKNNAPKIKISHERLSEILGSELEGSTPELSDQETKEMNKLKKMIEADKLIYDKKLDLYITSQKMTLAQYEEIKKQYHKDNKFQNKVNKLYNK